MSHSKLSNIMMTVGTFDGKFPEKGEIAIALKCTRTGFYSYFQSNLYTFPNRNICEL